MLSNVNSKCQAELETVNEFSSGLQIIEELIKNRVSEKLKTSHIAINLSPLLNDPLFCVLDKQNKNHMSIQDFLKLLVARWRQEIQYQQDIFNLKDQIIDEFNKLCNQMVNTNFIEDIKKQSQETVEALFIKTNFDKKHMAGDFCKCVMNGFENEMMNKINCYATYVLWMPFTALLPEGLIEHMKKTFREKIEKSPSKEKIVSASTTIKQYIEDQLKEKEIQIVCGISGNSSLMKTKNIIGINQLETTLKAAQRNNKACTLIINEVGKDGNAILRERVNIQTIVVKMSAKQYLRTNIPFTYEYLELKNLEDGDDFKNTEQILLKFPKCLKSANIQFKNNTQNEIKLTNKKQEQNCVYELHFIQNGISYNQMKFLARLCNNLQFQLSFTISNFQYRPKRKGIDEEIITLSIVFTHFKTLQHLNLDFHKASISACAIDHLAASISKMNQMTYLNLNFSRGNNSANNHSMTLFALAIGEMPNLRHLEFNFSEGNNEITDNGIIQLGRAIAKSPCIQQLILNYGNNPWAEEKNAVTDKGIEELSQSLAHLNNIQQLKLDFHGGNHEISDKGMQALVAALNNKCEISELCLNFSHGNNSITDASMDSLVDALKQMSSELTIDFDFWSNNNLRVTEKGYSAIRNAKNYKFIGFRYT